MPRLSAGQIIFLVFLVFAVIWTRDPRFFSDPTRAGGPLSDFLVTAAAIIIAITVHEFNHAFVAVRLGDQTPRLMGRLSLNPLRHLDPLGTLMLFVAHFGWGKPVLFNPFNLRVSPYFGSALVSLAGPVANIITAFLIVQAFLLFDPPLGRDARSFIAEVVQINILLAAFNLIPIPPLDGFGVVQGLLPPRLAVMLEPLRQYGVLILLLVVFLPQLGGPNLLRPIIGPITAFVTRLVFGGA
jgi:Zn-dependent protease